MSATIRTGVVVVTARMGSQMVQGSVALVVAMAAVGPGAATILVAGRQVGRLPVWRFQRSHSSGKIQVGRRPAWGLALGALKQAKLIC